MLTEVHADGSGARAPRPATKPFAQFINWAQVRITRRVADADTALRAADDSLASDLPQVMIVVKPSNPGGTPRITFDRPIEPLDSWSHFHEIARTLAETAGVLNETTTALTVEVKLVR